MDYLKTTVIAIVLGLLAVAGMAAVGHWSKRHKPTLAVRSKPKCFDGHTEDWTRFVGGFQPHRMDLTEDVFDEVDLTGTQRSIDNAKLSAALQRRTGQR